MVFRRAIGWFGLLLVLTSCAIADQTAEAEKLLEQALNGIANMQHFAFHGEAEVRLSGMIKRQDAFEGVVEGNDRLYIQTAEQLPNEGFGASGDPGKLYVRSGDEWLPATTTDSGMLQDAAPEWNPLLSLRQLREMAANVNVNQELSDSGVIVLDIGLDEEALTAFTRSSIRQRFDGLQPGAYAETVIRQTNVSGPQAERMAADMRQAVGTAFAKLDGMVATLSAQGSSRLWIDRETVLPRQMMTTTTLEYLSEGVGQQEASTAVYVFRHSVDRPDIAEQDR